MHLVRNAQSLVHSPQKFREPPNADRTVGGERSPELVQKFVPSSQSFVCPPRHRNQLPRRNRQQSPSPTESPSNARTILRPANSSAESCPPGTVAMHDLL